MPDLWMRIPEVVAGELEYYKRTPSDFDMPEDLEICSLTKWPKKSAYRDLQEMTDVIYY